MPVYLGARDLSGMFVGTHQFLVIVNNKLLSPRKLGNETVKAKYLGNKKGGAAYGLVIGAQNRGTLNVEPFEKSDYIATQEYFGAIETHFYKSDFDTEMHEVKFGVTEQIAIENIPRSFFTKFNPYSSLFFISQINLSLCDIFQ